MGDANLYYYYFYIYFMSCYLFLSHSTNIFSYQALTRCLEHIKDFIAVFLIKETVKMKRTNEK